MGLASLAAVAVPALAKVPVPPETIVQLASEDDAQVLLAETWQRLEDSRARGGLTASVGARWFCGQCGGYLSHGAQQCRLCRHAGPHVFGEESSLGGNEVRRARLRREHKRRNRRRL